MTRRLNALKKMAHGLTLCKAGLEAVDEPSTTLFFAEEDVQLNFAHWKEMIRISKSERPEKKWQAEFPSGKVVHFGASGYTDYTINKDPAVKNQYIARHSANEDWKNPETPGFLSRWLLWNKTSLKAAIKDTNARFGTKFALK